MPKSSQHPRNSPDAFRSFSTAGLVTSSFLASVEQEQMSSAAPTRFNSALPSESECTFAFYPISAHIATRDSVTNTLTIVGPDLVASRDTFPAGTLTIPHTPTTDVNEETVLVTIATQNQVSTEIIMIAKMLQKGTVFPLADNERGVLGLAGRLRLEPNHETTSSERMG